MRKISSWFGLGAFLLLLGCAGARVGVESGADPLTKLNDAELLFRQQDQPVLAEKLIRQAIDIYAERDDAHGLGNAYREYADLLRSDAVSGKWAAYYREHGFQDRTVTYENRMAKSSEYYAKALRYYSRAETQLQDAKKFGRSDERLFQHGDVLSPAPEQRQGLRVPRPNARGVPGERTPQSQCEALFPDRQRSRSGGLPEEEGGLRASRG